MGRGRPPKPTALKLLAGNPGKRPLNAAEPRFPAGAPKCPAWLPPEAKKVWKRAAPLLEANGLITLGDEDTFAAYCVAAAEHQAATVILAREGPTITVGGTRYGENGEGPLIGGQVQPHPAIARQRSAWAALRQYSAMFGLDPSSRGRLAVPGQQGEKTDPFEDFVNQRKA